jgi:hypothetical protein
VRVEEARWRAILGRKRPLSRKQHYELWARAPASGFGNKRRVSGARGVGRFFSSEAKRFLPLRLQLWAETEVRLRRVALVASPKQPMS